LLLSRHQAPRRLLHDRSVTFKMHFRIIALASQEPRKCGGKARNTSLHSTEHGCNIIERMHADQPGCQTSQVTSLIRLRREPVKTKSRPFTRASWPKNSVPRTAPRSVLGAGLATIMI
jgi:hypothetical protein